MFDFCTDLLLNIIKRIVFYFASPIKHIILVTIKLSASKVFAWLVNYVVFSTPVSERSTVPLSPTEGKELFSRPSDVRNASETGIMP